MASTDYESDLAEVRQIMTAIGLRLPKEISVAAIGVKSKTPYLALWAREALIWRIADLSRCATNALETQDIASATLLARATFESTAMTWHIRDLIENRNTIFHEDLHNNISKILLGWKMEKSFPEAYNVLTLIDKIDRFAPGARIHYDSLSETAHPNWSGVAGLYSKTIPSEYRTIFGRDGERFQRRSGSICNSLIASLSIFVRAYDDISDLMPIWISELEAL